MVFDKGNPAFCKKRFYSLLGAGIVTGILTIILGSVDSVLAGFYYGDVGLSAVSVTVPLASITGFAISVLVNGCRYIYPLKIGNFDSKSAGNYYSTGLTSALVVSALLLLLILLFGNRYFSFYGITGPILKYAEQYFRFYKFVYILTPVVSFINQMIWCDGDEKVTMTGMAVYFVLNVLLSIVCAAFMGMAGIGLGTLLAGIACFLIYCTHFFKKTNTLRYRFHFSIREQWELVKFGFVESTYLLFYGINGIVLAKFVCGCFGSEYMAAVFVVGCAMSLTTLFGAVSDAMVPLLDTYKGEGNNDGVKKTMRVTLKTQGIIGMVMTAAVIIAAPVFPRVFSIASPELAGVCVSGIRITAVSYIFIGITTVMAAYYNVNGRIIFSTVIARCKDSVFCLAFLILFGMILGMDGVWIGMMLSPVAACVLMFAIVSVEYGRENFLMLPEDNRAVTSYDLLLSMDSVISVRNMAEEFLRENEMPPEAVLKAALLIEDGFGLVIEKNEGNKKVMAELTVMAADDIELIFRDDGVIFDITDENGEISSFRAYIVSGFMGTIEEKSQITSLSFNRAKFHLAGRG